MGRELKRVPLDFDYPIGKIWSGYINPHAVHECKKCEGLGYSEEHRELTREWFSWDNVMYKPNPFRDNARYNSLAWSNNLKQEDVNALIEADRLWAFTRVPINEEQQKIVDDKIANGKNSWLPFNNGYIPTAEEVNEWNLKTMGHDSLNRLIIIEARLKREGKPLKCKHCNGTGFNWQHPKAKEDYENWEPYEVPRGEGFQLWDTTGEGSPKTPVFETLEGLCDYCDKEGVSVFGKETTTKEKWMEMLTNGFVYHKKGNNIYI